MSTQIQRRRGTTAEHSTFTGVEGEITVDTTKDTAVVHDGTTVGGHPLQKQYPPLGSAAAPTYTFTGDTNTGIYSPGADQVAVATNGAGRLFVDASGRVGVGAASAGARFRVNVGTDQNFTVTSTNSVAQLQGINDAGTAFAPIDIAGSNIRISPSSAEIARFTSTGLGIGTSAPYVFTQIEGQLMATGSADQFASEQKVLIFGRKGRTTLDRHNYISSVVNFTADNDNRLLFYVNDAAGTGHVNPLTLTGANRVGIGTTSPGYILDVKDAAGIRIRDAADLRFLRLIPANGTGNIPAKINSNSSLGLNIETNGFLGFSTNAGTSESARIDSSGRLLVGTSSAPSVIGLQHKFNVAVGAEAAAMIGRWDNSQFGPSVTLAKSRSASVGTSTVLSNNDQLGIIIFAGADGSDLDSVGAEIKAEVDGTPGTNDMPGRLVFSVTIDGQASPSEAMRITNGRRVYIGTTTGVIDTANFGTAFFNNGYFNAAGNFNGTQELARWYGNAGSVRFMGDGDVENTNNSYGALSDIKLKENVVTAGSQWDDIKALQVRKYNLKAETGYSTHTQIGLVAQEVELVSPGLVGESADRDSDGNDLGTVTKSVNYSVLYMKAVKALQEAMERIEALEAKVAALESA